MIIPASPSSLQIVRLDGGDLHPLPLLPLLYTSLPIRANNFFSRMQCEMVENGSRGIKLITETLYKTWRAGGLYNFYRGLPLALVGIFPYSAIDLGTFEYLKRAYVKKTAQKLKCDENDVKLPSWMTLGIGAVSGSVGASVVYPINLLRTRLQAQGTAQHPRTYTGMWDVTVRTFKNEGIGGMYRGLTPNMMKVIPAVSIVSLFH
jgi:solute carrier family 25 phosphate transporter 23/24/25/41